MRSIAVRSAFVATLCAGVGMVGMSVNGLLGIDSELQRSAIAAAEQRPALERTGHATPVSDWDCPASKPARDRV
jgi:hypothetical protein